MTNTNLNSIFQNAHTNEPLETVNISWDINSENLSQESVDYLNEVLIPELTQKMTDNLLLSKEEFSIRFKIDE